MDIYDLIMKQHELFKALDDCLKEKKREVKVSLLNIADKLMVEIKGSGHGIELNFDNDDDTNTNTNTNTNPSYEQILKELSRYNKKNADRLKQAFVYVKGISDKDDNFDGFTVEREASSVEDLLRWNADNQEIVDLILLAVHAFQVETGYTFLSSRKQVWKKRSPSLNLDPKSKVVPQIPKISAQIDDVYNNDVYTKVIKALKKQLDETGNYKIIKNNKYYLTIDLNNKPTAIIVKPRLRPEREDFDDIDTLYMPFTLLVQDVNDNNEAYSFNIWPKEIETNAKYKLDIIDNSYFDDEKQKNDNKATQDKISNGTTKKVEPSDHNENPLFEKYRSGDFNHLDREDFRKIVIDVDQAGLNISDVNNGVLNWFLTDESNRLSA